MGRYSYKLYKNGIEEKEKNRYRRSELEKMTTYQLREICNQEKLIKNILNPLDKEELIRLIMRYRGKEEVNFIKEFKEEGIERLENFLNQVKWIEKKEKVIQFPAKIVVYEGLGIDILDGYQVKSNSPLIEGILLLVNEQYQICTIFSLIEAGKDYYLVKEKEIPAKEIGKGKYNILYFEEKESEFIYDLYMGEKRTIPEYIKGYVIPILDFNIKSLPLTEKPLVIDFGSSNTTAGIYKDNQELEVAKIIKKENALWQVTPLIPSVIGIKEIREEEIQYVFGYEAIQIRKKDYLEEGLPIFYDIKRFLSDADRMEKIITLDGQHTWIERKDLLKEFLEYVIQVCCQRFKCQFQVIQLLAPVRQKEKFKHLFCEILDNYQIECELDEGICVLFDSIYRLIEQKKYEQNQIYQAFIIDCGGGTTDLTSSKFSIENHRVAYTITMQTSYENGDTNFGGNNLTYKIMQLLKIRLVEKFNQKPYQDFYCFQLDEFSYTEKVEKIYQDFEEAYQKAEQYLPTLFRNYEEKSTTQYFAVKNNYYYLFELAEIIKQKFFSHNFLYELQIGITQMEQNQNYDSRREFLVFDKWKLSPKIEGIFLPFLEVGPIHLYLYEVQALLKPAVYDLIQKFLEEFYQRDELLQYQLIKLTGQSCQAELFKEALKEFIPGRFIQGMRNQKENYELKLSCIYGALRYFQSKKQGYMEINHKYEVGALPYEVSAYTHENQEKVLIHSLKKEESTGYISRFKDGEELQLYLKDVSGTVLKTYQYYLKPEDYKECTYYEIEEIYPQKIIQDETDNIVNGESKFFVWAAREKWGFYVLPILRERETLYRGEAILFDFEDDTWEENFFDGSK